MNERVKNLDMEDDRAALAGSLGGPRRPLEDPDSGIDEVHFRRR